jgi:hypothetical protein
MTLCDIQPIANSASFMPVRMAAMIAGVLLVAAGGGGRATAAVAVQTAGNSAIDCTTKAHHTSTCHAQAAPAGGHRRQAKSAADLGALTPLSSTAASASEGADPAHLAPYRGPTSWRDGADLVDDPRAAAVREMSVSLGHITPTGDKADGSGLNDFLHGGANPRSMPVAAVWVIMLAGLLGLRALCGGPRVARAEAWATTARAHRAPASRPIARPIDRLDPSRYARVESRSPRSHFIRAEAANRFGSLI